MAKYNGTMTELKRVDVDGLSVVVSYWTDGETGEKYEPRLRFVIGERNRPVKGLTRKQLTAVRDAFNVIADEWGSQDEKPAKRATKKRTAKKSAAKKASADEATQAIMGLLSKTGTN